VSDGRCGQRAMRCAVGRRIANQDVAPGRLSEKRGRRRGFRRVDPRNSFGKPSVSKSPSLRAPLRASKSRLASLAEGHPLDLGAIAVDADDEQLGLRFLEGTRARRGTPAWLAGGRSSSS
jgi:hypothetical protein